MQRNMPLQGQVDMHFVVCGEGTKDDDWVMAEYTAVPYTNLPHPTAFRILTVPPSPEVHQSPIVRIFPREVQLISYYANELSPVLFGTLRNAEPTIGTAPLPHSRDKLRTKAPQLSISRHHIRGANQRGTRMEHSFSPSPRSRPKARKHSDAETFLGPSELLEPSQLPLAFLAPELNRRSRFQSPQPRNSSPTVWPTSLLLPPALKPTTYKPPSPQAVPRISTRSNVSSTVRHAPSLSSSKKYAHVAYSPSRAASVLTERASLNSHLNKAQADVLEEDRAVVHEAQADVLEEDRAAVHEAIYERNAICHREGALSSHRRRSSAAILHGAERQPVSATAALDIPLPEVPRIGKTSLEKVVTRDPSPEKEERRVESFVYKSETQSCDDIVWQLEAAGSSVPAQTSGSSLNITSKNILIGCSRGNDSPYSGERLISSTERAKARNASTSKSVSGCPKQSRCVFGEKPRPKGRQVSKHHKRPRPGKLLYKEEFESKNKRYRGNVDLDASPVCVLRNSQDAKTCVTGPCRSATVSHGLQQTTVPVEPVRLSGERQAPARDEGAMTPIQKERPPSIDDFQPCIAQMVSFVQCYGSQIKCCDDRRMKLQQLLPLLLQPDSWHSYLQYRSAEERSLRDTDMFTVLTRPSRFSDRMTGLIGHGHDVRKRDTLEEPQQHYKNQSKDAYSFAQVSKDGPEPFLDEEDVNPVKMANARCR
ncbi:unnamed protein product [Chondrus crispus]|uniref:Uncharacterized protein n=1 Tax=Chondrus crispus TaxID=2769 RepID=S0F2Z4_CHOCR|nr:unnamed protein product [Chondrus crispus]CDF77515.1 unnamed protein product [Chondrus crispus]|eukprot:XP_005717299.1 unnamed protein product [Chondrus crispus]